MWGGGLEAKEGPPRFFPDYNIIFFPFPYILLELHPVTLDPYINFFCIFILYPMKGLLL